MVPRLLTLGKGFTRVWELFSSSWVTFSLQFGYDTSPQAAHVLYLLPQHMAKIAHVEKVWPTAGKSNH